MKLNSIAVTLAAMSLLGCSEYGLGTLKERACEKWAKQGFECVDYEGYTWGIYSAQVWHRLKKVPDNGITYSGFVTLWNGELMVYGPEAIDAIKPTNR